MASEIESSDNALECENNFGIVAPHCYERTFHLKITDFFNSVPYQKVSLKQEQFETCCSCLNSSWDIKMLFELKKIKDSLFEFTSLESFSISCIKTNSGQIPLEATTFVWFLSPKGRECPVRYHVSNELPNKASGKLAGFQAVSKSFKVDDHYSCLIYEYGHVDKYKFFPDDGLNIKVQFYVKGCCNNANENIAEDKTHFEDMNETQCTSNSNL